MSSLQINPKLEYIRILKNENHILNQW